MAKALREPPPSSSVARLLDKDAAARAVAPPVEGQPAAESAVVVQLPHAVVRAPEPAHIKREFILSLSTAETLDQFVEIYRRATGSRLTSSHVLRAVLKGIAHSMEPLRHEAKRIGPLKLPGNARGREFDREQFENRLAEAFVAGIRAAASYHGE